MIYLSIWSVVIFVHSCTYAENNATQMSCPLRPANDLRGPPGISGRTGNKGEVGDQGNMISSLFCKVNFALYLNEL